MKLICSILLAITTLAGCTKKQTDTSTRINNMNNQDTTAGRALNYLALGDSYTVGEAVPASESFPYQLAAELTSHNVPVNTPTIIAATGWTTDELINDLFHDPITGKKFDIVTLLIGVNDQYQHLSQDNYRNRFQQVLDTAISFANGNKNHVFVLSIPDWGVTPFAAGQDSIIGPQIDQFNAINKQISIASGVNYLDITGISRQAASDPGLIASDGLHPSGKMYGQWVKLLVPLIAVQLTRN